ncbi:MAG TPA: endonuclease/exonuclease/phosphatase family protein [Blastocatellia bacterium]|nr:endonuclease/exonuclease/phosphatase family protein [Blastocatellia bacterium]
MSDTRAGNRHLIDDLGGFDTFKELRSSAAFSRHAGELGRLFNHPKLYRAEGARPRLSSFLRVVEWNIERGSRLRGIVEALNSHPVLMFADLLILNELDEGMVRSNNVNVALALSRELNAHAIYGAEYLEFTKGVGPEQSLPGENTSALHGNAILTRYPFSKARLARLPRCENNYESAERRLGGRVGIMVDLEIGAVTLTAATAHLDVVNTPGCRAKQMRGFLEAIESGLEGGPAAPVIFGGDLNTHTFARGGRLRALKNTVRILGGDHEKLARKLLEPERSEPALSAFGKFGYGLRSFNDRKPTSRTIVSRLEDAKRLPGPVNRWVMRRVGPGGILLEFRLDWIAARGISALRAGEITDAGTGVSSVDPQTFAGLAHEGSPLSDHDPIVVDVALPQR